MVTVISDTKFSTVSCQVIQNMYPMVSG